MLPSLDQKCNPVGCWYCSDLCHNCMQPAMTLYSGILENNTLLKFCCEQCKGLWFHAADQKPFYVASLFDETSMLKHPDASLMTIVAAGEKCVEQLFLDFVETQKEISEMPFIVWHIRGLESQYFAHFYVSKDCLPLKSVWMKHICTTDSELVYNIIAHGRVTLQPTLQAYFDNVMKRCNCDGFESLLVKLKPSRKLLLWCGELCNIKIMLLYMLRERQSVPTNANNIMRKAASRDSNISYLVLYPRRHPLFNCYIHQEISLINPPPPPTISCK